MLSYPQNYDDSKKQLDREIFQLKKMGYQIFRSKHAVQPELFIDKVTIKSKKPAKNQIILTTGLHGIEGYVGHACISVFLDTFLPILTNDTEVVIYHTLNPYGMKHYYRSNENNVDLNRNFSQNEFSDENLDYEIISDFFKPRYIKGRVTDNAKYYSSLGNLVRKYGTSTLNNAILRGQKFDPYGQYYSGTRFENSTIYVLSEMNHVFSNAYDTTIWLDIHTGYGPRYQMSIVNSKYERDISKELIDNLSYPRILGFEDNDFYDIDGDMIERIYAYHKEKKSKTDLLALCYEFGTLGDKTLQTIESLKAMYFSNNVRFVQTKPEMEEYAKTLMMKQFMPSEHHWRDKACKDFKQATNEILKYKKLI